MKKTVIFLSLIITGLHTWAQVAFPRTSLYEEFTGENCGPCLATNWNFDPILLSNPNSTLVIPIKWQVPLLSAPSNTWSLYQTNKAEIDWRWRSSSGSTVAAGPSTLAYGYPAQNTPTDIATNGINLLASGRFDGQHQWVFGAASDDPATVNNTVIAAAQSQTTNFYIIMTPSWSPTFTNCVVSVTVQSGSSFTAVGALMFRLCLVERLISFPNPPGINGEKNFYESVRKSYPTTMVGSSVTAMGTPLNNIWAPAQTQTFIVNCNIPSYIHDLSQMAFVGFVQDDGDRKVYQALRTPQPAIPNDMKAVSLNIPLSCSSPVTPSFVVQNLGPVAVSALTIAPYVDGIAQTVINYTGNIAGLSSATISLPSYTALYGNHTFSATITGVSGGDINAINNTTVSVFGISNSTTTGVSETFIFFPPSWYVLNYNLSAATWIYGTPGGFGASVGSAKYDLWNNYEWGDYDDLYLPVLNLTGVASPVLSFDVAYAQYTNQNDKLDIMASTDCGTTWTNVYTKQGAILSTAPSHSTSAFVPTATQWRTETVNLPSLANQPSVLMKYRVTTDFGNNLYIDNVNLGQPPITLIKEMNTGSFTCEVFPNPSSDISNLSISLSQNETVGISITNNLGQLVYFSKSNNLNAGVNTISLNTENFVSGVYFVNVSTSKGAVNTKLNIVK